MAMFRQHISLGAIFAVVGVIVLYFYTLSTDPVTLAIAFGLCTLGSLIPDVDSDSGLPFYLMFGTLTVAFGGVVLYYTLMQQPNSPYVLVGVPVVALLFFWFAVGGLVKRWTHHRGIWHSVPALAIAALLVFIGARYVNIDIFTSKLFASAMALGVLSHLLLDEIYSEVSFTGIAFAPKKSSGTALKLFSHSTVVNLCTYAIVAVLAYIAITIL